MNKKLTYQETDRLKGLLILLIVMGHIEQFFSDHELLQMLLYSFHVVSFLMIPFLFNINILNYQNIKKNARRIYVPYTLFYLLSVFLYITLISHEFQFFKVIEAWVIGSASLIKSQAGFSVLWFLPALFSTILLLMFYNRLSLKFKKVLLFFLLLTHLFLSMVPKQHLNYFPIVVFVPLYLFILGILIRYIYQNIDYTKYSLGLISTIFIGLLYISYGSNFNLATPLFPNIINQPFELILHDFIIVVGFFTMIKWSRKIHFFEWFGKYSLAVFTLHPFVIQLLNRLYEWNGIWGGVMKFTLVLFISYFLIRILYYLKLNNIVYPR